DAREQRHVHTGNVAGRHAQLIAHQLLQGGVRDGDHLIGRSAFGRVDVAHAEEFDVIGESERFDLEWVVLDVAVKGRDLYAVDAVWEVLIVECEGGLRTTYPGIDESFVFAVIKR